MITHETTFINAIFWTQLISGSNCSAEICHLLFVHKRLTIKAENWRFELHHSSCLVLEIIQISSGRMELLPYKWFFWGSSLRISLRNKDLLTAIDEKLDFKSGMVGEETEMPLDSRLSLCNKGNAIWKISDSNIEVGSSSCDCPCTLLVPSKSSSMHSSRNVLDLVRGQQVAYFCCF